MVIVAVAIVVAIVTMIIAVPVLVAAALPAVWTVKRGDNAATQNHGSGT